TGAKASKDFVEPVPQASV
ncbi:hypothetical protein A0J61_05223, partial [Choanephora cucurbitarum]